MGINSISLGASGKKKPIRKEINIQVKMKHIFYFFLFLMFIVVVMYKVLLNFGIDSNEMYLTCVNNQTPIAVEFGKEVYCGEHYTALEGIIPDNKYNQMESIINGN